MAIIPATGPEVQAGGAGGSGGLLAWRAGGLPESSSMHAGECSKRGPLIRGMRTARGAKTRRAIFDSFRHVLRLNVLGHSIQNDKDFRTPANHELI